MFRKTLTILSLLGLLLSVVLWGVSLRCQATFIPKSLRFLVSMGHGGASLLWPDKPYAPMPDFLEITEPCTILPEQIIRITHREPIRIPAEGCATPGIDSRTIPWRRCLGFGLPKVIQRQAGAGGRSFIVPFWIPTLLFAAVFWWSFPTIHRRRKRKKLGLCLKCGYDLRASKDRCPECGLSFTCELLRQSD